MFARLENLKKSYPKKLRLVLINNSCQWHRGKLTRALEKQLGSFNTYGPIDDEEYAVGVASSKFVLSRPLSV